MVITAVAVPVPPSAPRALLLRSRGMSSCWERRGRRSAATKASKRRLELLPETIDEAISPSKQRSSSRVRVPRQAYIHLPKTRLIELICEQGALDSEQLHGMMSVLTCLESIYGVEYQLAGEQLLQTFHRLNRTVVVPKGVEIVTQSMLEESYSDDWDDNEPHDWARSSTYRVEVEDNNEEGTKYVSEKEIEDQEEAYLRQFLELAAKAHFLPITPRDAAMAETLNDSYLAQLFIRPNAGAVDDDFALKVMDKGLVDELGGVIVFKRGWGKEHTKGRLLAPKLDFVQRVLAKGMLRAVKGTTEAVLGIFLNNPIAESLLLSSGTAEEELPPRSRGPLLFERGMVATISPSINAPRRKKRKPRDSQRVTTVLLERLRRSLEYYGLMPPRDKVELSEFEAKWPVHEAERHPMAVYVERVNLDDCLGGSQGSGSLQKVLNTLSFDTFLGKLELVEPTFREVLVLWRPSKPPVSLLSTARQSLEQLFRMIQNLPPLPRRPFRKERLHMRIYRDLPVPLWRIVYPFKAVAFRPISIIKVDLFALAGLIAIIAQAKYGNPYLQLVWIGSFLAQALRVVLQYRRMFIIFDSFVSKEMFNRTVAGSDGVLEFMSRSAALQQFKQVLLLYYTLLVKGDKLDICHAAVEVEGILASVGAQVDFNVEEARSELRRLGLLDCTGPSSTLKVLPPEKAVPRLMEHWNTFLLTRLDSVSSTVDGLVTLTTLADSLDWAADRNGSLGSDHNV